MLLSGDLPTESTLDAEDWMGIVRNDTELRHLYDVSALVVRQLASTGGSEEVHRLATEGRLDVPLDTFIEGPLREWLNEPWPSERAAAVLCGINHFLPEQDAFVNAWNEEIQESPPDYDHLRERAEALLATLQALSDDTIVEELRTGYEQSVRVMLDAVESYERGDVSDGNAAIKKGNTLRDKANEELTQAWARYMVVPCDTIEAQLGAGTSPAGEA